MINIKAEKTSEGVKTYIKFEGEKNDVLGMVVVGVHGMLSEIAEKCSTDINKIIPLFIASLEAFNDETNKKNVAVEMQTNIYKGSKEMQTTYDFVVGDYSENEADVNFNSLLEEGYYPIEEEGEDVNG